MLQYRLFQLPSSKHHSQRVYLEKKEKEQLKNQDSKPTDVNKVTLLFYFFGWKDIPLIN